MSFDTPFFLTVFMPAALFGAWLAGRACRSRVASNAVILLASAAFALWSGLPSLLCVAGSAVANHFGVLAMFRAPTPSARRRWCGAIVAANLLFLGTVKYAGLVAGTIGSLSGETATFRLFAALGISFYTFRAISYAVDVFRGAIEPARSLFDFACALAFFPFFTAGPIARLGPTLGELRDRGVTLASVSDGLRRFLAGLAKKALIADSIAVYADAAWGHAARGLVMPSHLAWLALACYALQIYYDFSGYTDMAIGLGRMLGFSVPENFDHPYAATSIRDFWRRWHISLSTWFRDYLYIPLGGNRKGLARSCANGVIVFALCGIWHGANWMFLLWGLWHGLFITIERLVLARRPKGARFLPALPGHIYATVVFLLGWLLFRSASLAECWTMAKSILGLAAPAATTRMLLVDASPRVIAAAAAGILFAFPPPAALRAAIARAAGSHPRLSSVIGAGRDIALTIAGAAALFAVAGSSYHAFLYAKF